MLKIKIPFETHSNAVMIKENNPLTIEANFSSMVNQINYEMHTLSVYRIGVEYYLIKFIAQYIPFMKIHFSVFISKLLP